MKNCYLNNLNSNMNGLQKSSTRSSINVLDWRSHRLQRVCRSSYASVTLALEEALDAAQLLRGQTAEIRGADVETPRQAQAKAAAAKFAKLT